MVSRGQPQARTTVRSLARALLRGGIARPHLSKLAAAGMHFEVALKGRKGKSVPRHLRDSIGVAHTVAKTLLSLKQMADGSEHPSNESVGGAVAPRRCWGLLQAIIAVDARASEGVTDHSSLGQSVTRCDRRCGAFYHGSPSTRAPRLAPSPQLVRLIRYGSECHTWALVLWRSDDEPP